MYGFCLIGCGLAKLKKTTLTGFEPVRENPMDFKSIALTTRPQYLNVIFLLNVFKSSIEMLFTLRINERQTNET